MNLIECFKFAAVSMVCGALSQAAIRATEVVWYSVM